MNKEFHIVMNDETARCVAEVLRDWAQDAIDIGFPEGTAAIKHVAAQVESENKRLFTDTK